MSLALSIQQHPLMLAKRFSQAAPTFDRYAVFQQELGSRLIERLSFLEINPSLLLDLGSGTGFHTDTLSKRYPQATVLQCDFSIGMLQVAPKRFPRLCGNATTLPLPDNSIDFVFANCLLPWISEPQLLFREVKRVLRSGGLFLFSSVGPDTLIELKTVLQQLISTEQIPTFMDLHEVGDLLVQTGFHNPVMETEKLIFTYRTPIDLLRDLWKTGSYKAQLPLNKSLVYQINQAYLAFVQDKHYNATFECQYGHANI